MSIEPSNGTFHVKHSKETQPKRRYRPRNGNVSVCPRCNNEPRLPNQRYGRACHADAQREYYHRLKAYEAKVKEILRVLQGHGVASDNS